MLILGIETSCDETSAAVVEDGRLVRSNVISSQIAAHLPYGGVVPEIASRQHLTTIRAVVDRALADASLDLDGLDTVAATYGPGLAGALLVGVNFSRGLAVGRGIPFVPVNHLEGHLHSVWLTEDPGANAVPALPLLALIVSGGHTELVLMRDHGVYELLGRTRDDAAGEAFDKVARLLGLPYPGGPAVDRAARAAVAPVRLPRAWMPGTYDFSFSGLKTAVLHLVQETATGEATGNARHAAPARLDMATQLTPQQVADIAAGFQESVVDVLVAKTMRAAEEHDVRSVAVVGGVAANASLRASMRASVTRPLYIAAPSLSTDNAAMIAAAAYYVPRLDRDIDISPALTLVAS